jgi:DNA polymerase delta subunit 4
MPPTRRSRTSSGLTAKGSQKTISFGPTKVSKTPSTKSKLPPSPLSKTSDIDIDVGHISSEAAIQQPTSAELDRVKKEGFSLEEEKARKVTDAQIKRYWREREAERRAPRVHQEDLGVEEKVLRLWDMSSQYGVSASMPNRGVWAMLMRRL